MGDQEKTTALGMARYAQEYYDAALAADDVLGMREGYEIIAPPPVMFLVAHSIELALKSYLIHIGMPLGEIRRYLGHDLVKCWGTAKKHGIEDHVTLAKVDLEVLGLINDLHISTQLRYIETGWKDFTLPRLLR